jgi:hypothetical protein
MIIGIRPLAAVLTGDIVNSTGLTPGQEGKLIKELVEVLNRFFAPHLYEFFRGDSFQVYLKDPAEALRMALVCRGLAIGIAGHREEESAVISDVRVSIGIGEVSRPVKTLGLAKGEAFLLSGRQFDQLKEKEQRLAICCSDPVANIGFEVMADHLDSIYSQMTVKQAHLIVALLQGITQQQYAEKEQRSKSTVSRLASSGRWPEIEKVLGQYEKLINLIL